MKICWEIVIGPPADRDSDALPDAWEVHGIDTNNDGAPDYNLAAQGADPDRKDIFVEIDCLVAASHSHCPAQNALIDVVQAFANAPVGTFDPTFTRGVQLHLDTGNMFGPGLILVPGARGVAGNVGDMGGGGTQMPEAGNTIIDWDGATGSPGTDFHNLRAMNFNAAGGRDLIFRYAIFGHQTNSRAAANDCTSGRAEDAPSNDFMVTSGGATSTHLPTVPSRQRAGAILPTDSIDNDGDGRTDEDPAVPYGVDDDGDCVPAPTPTATAAPVIRAILGSVRMAATRSAPAWSRRKRRARAGPRAGAAAWRHRRH